MKKLVLCVVILFVTVSVFANPINLGNFPVGKWLDPNYNVIWEFSSNNIRILSTSGAVLYDFSDKSIQDFGVFMDGMQPGISFTCPEAGRSYRFIKPLANSDLIMEIDRSGLPKYTVSMKMQ
ncbi:MAG: hypothetical protein LBH07_09085 [Treponema sp.]|jgi:hypothetical protein|nr:hypothetical protein [Treponema sp.]